MFEFISLLNGRKGVLTLLAVVYAAGAILSAWQVISHTQASTQAIEQILLRYNMKNEGAKTLKEFSDQHPLLGFFISSPAKHEMELPSVEEANDALYTEVTHFLKMVRVESFFAAWWSWFLLSLSFFYVVAVIGLERSFFTRPVLYALTSISLIFFTIGILAPAMVIWTTPSIPLETGKLEFVLQHEVRGIAAIIWELLTSGHWIIGGFLLLFSILTPLTKAFLTFFVTASRSRNLNYQIGELLHSIGKWSMADVFVAGILLALYALKAQEATKSIPCLGLYYFLGYCLLSMATTELLTHSGVVAAQDKPEKPVRKLRWTTIAGLGAIFLCFVLASSLYTYEQYTVNTKQKVTSTGSPQKLNNADLVLPVHK